MISEATTFVAFGPDHLEAATRLSQQAGWPHRLQDWQMALALSEGCVAVAPGPRVIGTALMTPYGRDTATINMVIVDARERGRGLGRRLMQQVLTLADDRRLQLVATEEGLPLYETLGFCRIGRIVQHQGHLGTALSPSDGVRAATAGDIAAIAALDAAAFGADRSNLIAHLAAIGEFTVLERDGPIAGFAASRRFGCGLVIGPVVASGLEDAQALVAHCLAANEGEFVRLDTGTESGLGPWLAGLGLPCVGGGVLMVRPSVTTSSGATSSVTTQSRHSPSSFTLASQAFG
ncbi:MAG: GNAT family N-acetyltransferase [Bradyrhizobium sp.]